MKIRNGFVSNSSSTSFCPPVWVHYHIDKRNANYSEMENLRDILRGMKEMRTSLEYDYYVEFENDCYGKCDERGELYKFLMKMYSGVEFNNPI